MPKNETAKTLGEHKIIEFMRRHFEVMPNMSVPFGDDVSAVPLAGGEVAVLKTDMLVGKTDVPAGMTMFQAARKAVVMAISDFAAKGASPQTVLVALGVPENLTAQELEQIAQGLNVGAREYGAYVVGGDTAQTDDLIIAIQLFGTAKQDTLMLRSGARAGDVLAVTGCFGRSAAGLKILLEGAKAGALRDGLVDAVLCPVARLREGLTLAASGAVSAAMDSSDGLAWCLHELAEQGGVGFLVDALPVCGDVEEFAALNELDAAELALFGGEEYELVVTVKPQMWAASEASVAAVGGKLLRIGVATADKRVLLRRGDKTVAIAARGYEHFKT
jgi:thiamine-monophosphate kinase